MTLFEEFKKEKGNNPSYFDYGNQDMLRADYTAWLEEELEASRDSRLLSAVPSDVEIHKEAIRRIKSAQKTGNKDDELDLWSYKEGARFVINFKRGIAG